MHPHDALRDVLVLALPEQLPLAKLVDAQALAHTCKKAALKREEAQGHIIQGGGVDELQVVPLIIHVGLDGRLRSMSRVERHVVDRANNKARLIRQLREVAHCQAERSLIDIQVQLEHRRKASGVDNPHARAPLALTGFEGANLAFRQVLLFLVFFVLHIVQVIVDRPRELDLLQRRADLALRLLVVGVVVSLEHRQHDGVVGPVSTCRQGCWRQRHEAPRRVGEVHNRLVEELTQPLARNDPQSVPRDGNKTLRALL
mmetsp:Transcript_20864/g.58886  ORF Transcript_20864/g.58886 Transcript_20864/m.58886 type:complete len:258 (+) Transcript_20864:741-1514(+)